MEDLSRHPEVSKDKIVLYVRKAIPAPTENSLKPLMILEALNIPYSIHLIKSLPDETWFHKINPHKKLPAMEDVEVFESADGKEQRLNVFDSAAILIYLCDKYDKKGLYIGKGLIERAQVMAWLIGYTAGLGATGEWWLRLRNSEELAPALKVIEAAIRREYDVLEARLSEPGQNWIALPDRPTLADFAIQPLANPRVARNAQLDMGNWPHVKTWSEAVDNLDFVKQAALINRRLGMTAEEIQQHGR